MSNYVNRNDLIEMIQRMPSEVKPEYDRHNILCKDCKHWSCSTVTCAKVIGYWFADDYCSRAERKEE